MAELKARHSLRSCSLLAFLEELGCGGPSVREAKAKALLRFHPDKNRHKSRRVRPGAHGRCDTPAPPGSTPSAARGANAAQERAQAAAVTVLINTHPWANTQATTQAPAPDEVRPGGGLAAGLCWPCALRGALHALTVWRPSQPWLGWYAGP